MAYNTIINLVFLNLYIQKINAMLFDYKLLKAEKYKNTTHLLYRIFYTDHIVML